MIDERMMDLTLLGRLARVLAPSPRIFVFKNVEGIALDIKRAPHTHQPLIGVSGALYRRLVAKLMNEQGTHLDYRVADSTIVPSPMLELVFPDLVASVWDAADAAIPHMLPRETRVTIEPKPVRQTL